MVKTRKSGFSQSFKFTTLSICFTKTPSTENVTNFDKLLKWIRTAFIAGLPEDVDTYESCSSATIPQPTMIEEIPRAENEFLEIMNGCDYRGSSQFQHEKVGKHFLTNDKRCVALEMPLWISADKSANNQPWAGSVDIVRIMADQKVQICDFKPDAHKVDKLKVGAQLCRYGAMLSILTSIPLQDITLIYFDEKKAYKVTI